MTFEATTSLGVRSLFIALLWVGTARAQQQSLSPEEITKATDVARRTLVSMAGLSRFEGTGFASKEEVQKSSLGESMQDAFLPEAAVIGPTLGNNFMLRARLVFPVVFDSRQLAFLEVEKKASGVWRPTWFGDSATIRRAFEFREDQHSTGAQFFLVRSPPMRLTVLGMRRNGAIQIVPLDPQDPHFGGRIKPISLREGLLLIRKYYLELLLGQPTLTRAMRRDFKDRLAHPPRDPASGGNLTPRGLAAPPTR